MRCAWSLSPFAQDIRRPSGSLCLPPTGRLTVLLPLVVSVDATGQRVISPRRCSGAGRPDCRFGWAKRFPSSPGAPATRPGDISCQDHCPCLRRRSTTVFRCSGSCHLMRRLRRGRVPVPRPGSAPLRRWGDAPMRRRGDAATWGTRSRGDAPARQRADAAMRADAATRGGGDVATRGEAVTRGNSRRVRARAGRGVRTFGRPAAANPLPGPYVSRRGTRRRDRCPGRSRPGCTRWC